VLSGMRRRYRAEQVERAVELLRGVKPEAFLAADVIVGFPGEEEADFLQTRALVERLRFSRLHVFPFSPRPGTAAAAMTGRVPERVRDERARNLRALSTRLYRGYAESWRGREAELVLEKKQAGGGRQRQLPEGASGLGSGGGFAGTGQAGVARARPDHGARRALPGRAPGAPVTNCFLVAMGYTLRWKLAGKK
jgi:hypothetical protein